MCCQNQTRRVTEIFPSDVCTGVEGGSAGRRTGVSHQMGWLLDLAGSSDSLPLIDSASLALSQSPRPGTFGTSRSRAAGYHTPRYSRRHQFPDARRSANVVKR
jgi:hypothetical protein